MKRLTQILALSVLLSLVLVPATMAETEEGPALNALPTAVVDAMAKEASGSTPSAATVRPDPVFLAGSGAGGAGGKKAGLVNGESSSLPSNSIFYDDHLCCQSGSACDCVYWPGSHCDPLGCPYKSPPSCQ